MNLILKKDVENLGRFGDHVKVADGYGRNYLLPQGLAVLATPGNLRQLEAERDAYLKKAQGRREQADKLKADLEAVSLTFTRKSGDDDKLFGSVTTHDIETELKAKGFSIEKKDIHLAEHIKTLGSYQCTVKLHMDVVASINLSVVKE